LGFEETEFEDLIIPRFVFMQGLSPEVLEGVAKAGDIWNSLDKTRCYGTKVEIIPVIHFKSRIRWVPKDEGGGTICRSDDGRIGVGDPGGNCQRCSLSEWTKDKKPGCDMYENVICVVRNDYSMPVALSGSRTKIKGIKELISLARFSNDDLFGRAYVLKSVMKKNPKGTFFVPQVEMVGKVTEDEKLVMLEMFKKLRRIKVKVQEEGSEVDPTPETI
jgi:hypothetical protein